jgi:hypothetical protein
MMNAAHRRRHPLRVRRWLVPGALVLAAILCLGVAGCGPSPVSAPAEPGPAVETSVVPSYYAETTAARSPAYSSPDNISIRDTSTGAIVATVKPPRPYQSFGYVYSTGIPDTWVAGAQPWHPIRLDNSAQPVTLFDVTYYPATRRVEISKLPVPAVPGTDLAAVALSSDGTGLAEVTLVPGRLTRSSTGSPAQAGVAVLRVYTLTGGAGEARVSSRPLASAAEVMSLADYSLTWLDDGQTLAIGGLFGSVTPVRQATVVHYVDASVPGRLADVRTVALKFPAPGTATFDATTAAPTGCGGPPIATSDGNSIVCGGLAATAMNWAGYTNVGIWAFDARTGQLTATWDRHSICCAISATMEPNVLWVGPTVAAFVATGITQVNQGAELYVRNLTGLHRVPWPGLLHYPERLNIVEPAVAW